MLAATATGCVRTPSAIEFRNPYLLEQRGRGVVMGEVRMNRESLDRIISRAGEIAKEIKKPGRVPAPFGSIKLHFDPIDRHGEPFELELYPGLNRFYGERFFYFETIIPLSQTRHGKDLPTNWTDEGTWPDSVFSLAVASAGDYRLDRIEWVEDLRDGQEQVGRTNGIPAVEATLVLTASDIAPASRAFTVAPGDYLYIGTLKISLSASVTAEAASPGATEEEGLRIDYDPYAYSFSDPTSVPAFAEDWVPGANWRIVDNDERAGSLYPLQKP
ncbi:MAG: hypothetical protein NXI16_05085 [Alphaproteobacteria bacterium]|nr:hypothetical protein [Alphaproteobacteria bacterium]